MNKGLKCPLFGSWYSTSNETKELGVKFEAGAVCGNMAMTGPNPKACSPENPCKGRLVPVEADKPDTGGKQMKEITGKLMFLSGDRPIPLVHGKFTVVRESAEVILTYPCVQGTLTHETASRFDADDGRTWSVTPVGVSKGVPRFLVDGNV